MRTNIDIDDELMQQAMAASGAKSKKAVVEEALRRMVQLNRQGEAIRKLRGLATWVGHDGDWFAPDPLDPEWNAELAEQKRKAAVAKVATVDLNETLHSSKAHGNR